MTKHDEERYIRALTCNRNDMESLRHAVVGLQSTDAPELVPLWEELSDLYSKKLKEQKSSQVSNVS